MRQETTLVHTLHLSKEKEGTHTCVFSSCMVKMNAYWETSLGKEEIFPHSWNLNSF